jgi:hypothetical protein
LNKWKSGDDPEMKKIMQEEEEWTYKMFDRAVNEEKRWADYLFKDGSMIGLNDKLLQQYVMIFLQITIHFLGHSIGFLLRVFKLHLRKQKLNLMLLVVSNKMLKRTHLVVSNFDLCLNR